MKKRINIEKVIDELTEQWLGEHGVVAISDEEQDGERYIVFFVDRSTIQNREYPTEAQGYRVAIRPSQKIVSYGR